MRAAAWVGVAGWGWATLICAGLALGQDAFAQGAGVGEARYARLARGINLTRWFQYGDTITITAADRDVLRGAGFTAVRIPVAPQHLLRRWSGAAEIDATLARLDAAIELFTGAGMAVTLDFHADVEYLDYYLGDARAPDELVDTWSMLAARYADRNPELLFFEVMNEPDSRFSQAGWDFEQRRVLAAIRRAAPAHTVLLSPANWGGLEALLAMSPYEDTNVIYTLHYYSPAAFTHQGATWTGQPDLQRLRGIPWPAQLREASAEDPEVLRRYASDGWDADRIGWDMRLAGLWARRNKVKVIVNEFGAYKPFTAVESRARWLHDARRAIEAQHMAWAMWDYAAGFDLVRDSGTAGPLDQTVLAALGWGEWKAPAVPQDGEYSSLRPVQIGAQPDARGFAEGMLAADINGDGLTDVIVTPATYPTVPEHQVQFFLNDGGGVLAPGLFEGAQPTVHFAPTIVPGHFDLSGRAGFFLADRGDVEGEGVPGKLLLPSGRDRLRDATSNLPAARAHTAGAAAGDVDGDGVDDLVVFTIGGAAQLLRNDGTGHFVTDPQVFPATQCGVFAGRDLLLFGEAGNPGHVFRNHGQGHFRPVALLPPGPPGGAAAIGGCAVVADLNGDGLADVIAGFVRGAEEGRDAVQILINQGDGSFRDETQRRIGELPGPQGVLRRVVIARGERDRGWSLVLTRVGLPPLIFAADPRGVFHDSGWVRAFDPWVVVPGDFNADGKLDLYFGQGGGAPLLGRFGRE